MKTLDILLASPTIQMFGWVLLHSLWQGIILAVLLKGFLTLSRNLSANSRYLIACAALLLLLLLPISTTLWNHSTKQIGNSGEARLEITEPDEKVIKPSETIAQSNIPENESTYGFLIYRVEQQLLPWLVLLWLIGVFVSSLRLVGAWTFTQRLKLSGRHSVSRRWRETLQKLCRELACADCYRLAKTGNFDSFLCINRVDSAAI
jgi:hypothetical protein